MTARRQPRAFGYIQFWPFADAPAKLDQHKATISEYFRRSLEPRGVAWAQFVVEPASETKRSLSTMPEGRQLFAEIKRGDHLLVATIASAFQSSEDFWGSVERLARCASWLHVVDRDFDASNAEQLEQLRAAANIVNAWSTFDREQSRGRRRVANANRRLEGRHVCGSAPLGFKVVGQRGDRRLVPDEEARKVMRWIVKQHDEHAATFAHIRQAMNDDGMRWKKKDQKARARFTLEFWTVDRVRLAYFRMLEIEKAESEGKPFQPRPVRNRRQRPALLVA